MLPIVHSWPIVMVLVRRPTPTADDMKGHSMLRRVLLGFALLAGPALCSILTVGHSFGQSASMLGMLWRLCSVRSIRRRRCLCPVAAPNNRTPTFDRRPGGRSRIVVILSRAEQTASAMRYPFRRVSCLRWITTRSVWHSKTLQPAIGTGRADFLKKWYFWATHSKLDPIIDAARTVKRHRNGILRGLDSKIANGPS